MQEGVDGWVGLSKVKVMLVHVNVIRKLGWWSKPRVIWNDANHLVDKRGLQNCGRRDIHHYLSHVYKRLAQESSKETSMYDHSLMLASTTVIYVYYWFLIQLMCH